MLAKLKDENELERQLSSSPEPERSEVESKAMVECPVAGDLLRKKCLEYQAIPRKFATANPQKAQMWRACRSGCPNSLIGLDEDPIEDSAYPKNDQDSFLLRIKLLIAEKFSNNESLFARTAGISTSGLKRYLAGGDPTRRKLIAMANANNVNLLWLATGDGPKEGSSTSCASPALDEDALALALEAVDEALALAGKEVDIGKKAGMAAAVYGALARPGGAADHAEIMRLIRSMLG